MKRKAIRKPMIWVLALALTGSLLAAVPSHAQIVIEGVDDMDFDRTESWAIKYFTSASLLTGFGAPRALEPGAIELAGEGGWVPQLNAQERTVGFIGAVEQDLNKTEVFGRLRLTVGLPAKFSLTVAYVPPVEAGGAKPNLFAAALGRPLYESEHLRLGARLHGQIGKTDGDFTCDRETVAAGNDPVRNPIGCIEPSDDEVTMNYAGFELSASFPLGNRFEPYVAASVNYMDLEFQANARYNIFHDRLLLVTDGYTYSFAAGASLALSKRISLVGEAFYTPLDVVRPPRTASQNDDLFNVRGMIRYRLR